MRYALDRLVPISIHALRKESDFQHVHGHAGSDISIHALRKESDRPAAQSTHASSISIHALRKESDA